MHSRLTIEQLIVVVIRRVYENSRIKSKPKKRGYRKHVQFMGF